MNGKRAKAVREIDRYLDSLSSDYMTNVRSDRLYEKLFHDIAGIVLRLYKDLDITKNTELSITTDTTGGAIRTIVTGYIRVSENHYLQIEKRYLSKGEQDEENN